MWIHLRRIIDWLRLPTGIVGMAVGLVGLAAGAIWLTATGSSDPLPLLVPIVALNTWVFFKGLGVVLQVLNDSCASHGSGGARSPLPAAKVVVCHSRQTSRR